jgi:enoyl-CoA hydratase/carnithine racemase
MRDELTQTFAVLGADRAVRAVVLTGAGRGFCSGLDVRNFGPAMLDASAPAIERLHFQEAMAALTEAIRALPQPVIAAVNGPCVGAGLALCLASDVRICSRAASFGNAAILLGLSGGEMGTSYHLPRIVGTSVAADWMLTGRTVSADEADRRGLVSELVDADRLLERALELASLIAGLAPLGVQLTKRALQANTDAPLDAALELENRNQVLTHATDEAAARRQAWSARGNDRRD